MDTAQLKNLASEWREQADQIERWGAENVVQTLRTCAEDLEECLAHWHREQLTPEQAAAKSGYSKDHIRRLVREGKIPNAGEAHSPRIRRRDLPRKPGYEVSPAPRSGSDEGSQLPSRKQMARSVVDSD